MSRNFGMALSAALLATVVVAAPAHASTTAVELDRLPGTTEQEAAAINDAGVVAGSATIDGSTRAVKWDADGTVSAVGGPNTKAKAVNSSGVIAGETKVSGAAVAVRFDLDGTHTVLGAIPGHNAVVTGVDDAGVVYGYSLEPSGVGAWLAVRWDLTGVLTPLAVPDGTTTSQVSAVSPNGFATGWVEGERSGAVRWNPDGSVTRLPGLEEHRRARGTGVNRHGDVVGTAEYRSTMYSVRWNHDGTIIQFDGSGRAAWINDEGVVVSTVGFKAVRWSPTGERTDLRWPTGSYLGRVTAINSSGVVVGHSGDGTIDPKNAVKWVLG
ncbi:hypothetical protein GCM10011609_55880 [Lentzea pudingi]|uniref:YD repeat-containing protein n=1 Tax=Lentzea pudingi TaxID=1789439 RepID=A0ABQ2IFY1_9PSEU|nr:hypothetical protein [Lentzea pudingi]GGN08974.1 hypothetical protein GCM10011609_55880 [Lentzea pudingi]